MHPSSLKALVLASLIAAPFWAQAKAVPVSPKTHEKAADRYHAFAEACTEAFAQSTPQGGPEQDTAGVGRKICDCTAQESKHEKVTARALTRETNEIRRDPKHQIADQRLLNALHYCSIEVIKASSAEGE